MKNRVLTFIIGILVGAILSTLGFLIYIKSINNNVNPNQFDNMQMNGEMQPSNGNMGEPPEKPDDNMGMQP